MRWRGLIRRAGSPAPGEAIAKLRRIKPSVAELSVGTLLDEQYRILAVLGEGGFGRVFRCENPQGRLCAIKALRTEALSDPSSIALVRKEVQRWVELGLHPHIVTAFGLIEHARLPCIVMEHLQGFTDLWRTIGNLSISDRAGESNWRSSLRYGAQLAAALDHAVQRSGLVHRDIKPANILVRGDGWAKLTDFGISVAQLTENDALGHLQVGTVPYMAPELWRNEPRYSAQSDFYALGITLYEAAFGRHPLSGSAQVGQDDFARLHRQATPHSPLAADPAVPPAFAALLLQCLDKDPARRPKGTAELRTRFLEMCDLFLGESPLRSETAIDEAESWINRATMYILLGMADEALECAVIACNRAPKDPNALLARGNANALAKRNDEAVIWFSRASDLAGAGDSAALGNLALALHAMGKHAEAKRTLEQVVDSKLSNEQYARLNGLSALIVDLLEPARALAICDRIIACQPQAAIAWSNRAILLRRMGRPQDAEESALSALAFNPLYAKAWTNLANALMDGERTDEAREAAERALELDERLPGAHAALYAASMAAGRIDDAEAALLRGLAILPDDPLLKRNRELLDSFRNA